MRKNERAVDELRPLKIIPHYLDFARGSAYIEMGKNKIITSATLEERVPPFLKGRGQGWINAEYSMLPTATEKRNIRERNTGRITGRTHEIQRLIGRSLRTAVDLTLIGERTIIIDCDVIQADGGTRTASITGGCISLALIMHKMMKDGLFDEMPLKNLVAAVSVGVVNGIPLLDLDYGEDSNADIDMNVVKTDTEKYIEIQTSAEKKPLTKDEFEKLIALADKGIEEIIHIQKAVLKKESMLFMAYG